jgi:ATP synthase protein I
MAPTRTGRPGPKDPPGEFGRTVGGKCRRKLRADQEKGRSIWMGMGMFGLVGWSIALPTLLGLGLGRWLDGRMAHGFSWTLALMLAGLTLGIFNIWGWMNLTAGQDPADKGDETDAQSR